jgi:NhaP-type Na+/H+ and K+/H+ antiporter
MRVIRSFLLRVGLIVASKPVRLGVSLVAVLATSMASTARVALAQGLGTGSFRNWLLDNLVPAALLIVALLLIWLGGGRGENSQVMRRVIGVLVALAVLGLAVTGAGKDIGTWLANLFRG